MVIAAPAIARPYESRCLFCLRNAIEEGFLATKAEIGAAAKALCFRACTDCKSADECDPDENWIEEALTHPSYIQTGTTITSTTATTAVMSTTPTSKDTIANGDSIGVWPPIYQVVPLSSDYRTSDTATTLNASSSLITCLKSIAAPGGYGTFYADAINVAQSNLTASARSGARNVIILMSDGEANATSANMVEQGTTTTASNECKAAITAAQNAASAGTWVYTISYGTASSGGCTTDSGSYANACYVMSQIANVPGAKAGTYVNDPTKFYADDADGCSSSAHPSITALNSIFLNIEYSLTTPRLIPNACLANPPPGWC